MWLKERKQNIALVIGGSGCEVRNVCWLGAR